MNVAKIPNNPSYMKLVRHSSLSQRQPFHLSSFLFRFNIIDALKMTKSRRMTKPDHTTIDFDSIVILDVKYLPPLFDDDVIFILPPTNVDGFSTYGHFMDDMDKMCNGYHWCTIKTTKIQNGFGLSFRCYLCAGHLRCTNKYCDYMYRNKNVHSGTEWIK